MSFTKILESDSHNRDALYQLGNQSPKGRYRKALEPFDKVLELPWIMKF